MFNIRKANLDDAEKIADIHVNTWKSTYTELLNEKDLSNMTYENRKVLWETILKIQRDEQCTFVIEDGDKMVGFISGGVERTKRFEYDSEIYNIYLVDDYQKKGLGARLLKTFAEEMKQRGHKSILVWVLKQNPSSKFYERYKAEPVGKEISTIGKGTYEETAYGWEDIDYLLGLMDAVSPESVSV